MYVGRAGEEEPGAGAGRGDSAAGSGINNYYNHFNLDLKYKQFHNVLKVLLI